MEQLSHRYFVLHKPANMVSQFISSHQVPLLGDINFAFPEGTHAIGRLDNHSEGLLLLTTDKSITKKLFQGEMPHTRKYLVKVKKIITDEAIEKLRNGVSIRVQGGYFYTTIPCEVELVNDPTEYVTVEEEKPYQVSSWIMMTLVEGKFHQVRKMVYALGFKCLRLIRVAIEDITLENLKPGGVKELSGEEFYRLLKLKTDHIK